MNKNIVSLAAIVLSGLFSTSSIQALEAVKVSTLKVNDQIHMLSAKGGNVAVFIGKDGTFVIDDQFAPLTKKLMAAIKELGGDTPKFLVNTHFHGDHSGGNENFGNKGVLIVSHDNVRERLLNGSNIAAFGMKTPPAPAAALPVITYANKMHFHINAEDVNLVHVANAHTDGDSFVHFKNANVIHAGDVFFNGFYPFIDSDHGGTLKGMINAVDKILALSNAETKIIPGHGALANKQDLEAYKAMLETAYSNLIKLKNQGLSADDAKAKKPLAALDKKWSGGIFNSDKWIDIVYPAVR